MLGSSKYYSGGYHANTHLKCNLILFINCVAVMGIITLAVMYRMLGNVLSCLAMVFAAVVIYKFAPMDNENKEIPMEKREGLKQKSVIAVLVLELSACCLWLIEKHISVSVLMGLLSAAVS